MLQLRRSEKDFLLRRKVEYLATHGDIARDTSARLGHSPDTCRSDGVTS